MIYRRVWSSHKVHRRGCYGKEVVRQISRYFYNLMHQCDWFNKKYINVDGWNAEFRTPIFGMTWHFLDKNWNMRCVTIETLNMGLESNNGQKLGFIIQDVLLLFITEILACTLMKQWSSHCRGSWSTHYQCWVRSMDIAKHFLDSYLCNFARNGVE